MVLGINNLLIICAFVSFVLATIGINARVNLVALGLALYMLALLIR